MRDSSCDVGPIAEGDYLGIGPSGIRAVEADLVDAAIGLLDAIVDDEHEILTVIEGEGATAGDHAAHHRVAGASTGPTSRSRSTTAASRSTRTTSGSSDRRARLVATSMSAAGKPPIPLAELAAMDVESLKGVGPKRASALAQVEISSVLDLLTHYPRRYLDRTREARIADLEPGDEAMVMVRSQRVNLRRTREVAARMVEVDVTDGSGHLRCHLLQPALA